MKVRTHRCGELNKTHVGQTVVLNGWVQRRRDHGTVIFMAGSPERAHALPR